MTKKILSLILISSVFTCSFTVNAENFQDIKNNTQLENVVQELMSYGIINGYEDGTFKPENKLTRAEVCAIITRTLENGRNNNSSGISLSKFNDVTSSHWAYDYIMKNNSYGIVTGYDDNTFQPDNNITYKEYIKMIICMISYQTLAEELGGYPDGYINAAINKGIISDKEFSYDEEITRADAVTILLNALNTPIMYVNEMNFSTDKNTYETIAETTYKDIFFQKWGNNPWKKQ